MSETFSNQETMGMRREIVCALDRESGKRRVMCLLLACLLAVIFLYVTQLMWVSVHGGVDQNGYLVGGKLLAENGSMAYRPVRVDTGKIDPYQFVGRMWVGFDLGTPAERHLPKYPVGLPLIYAGCLKLGGAVYGQTLIYLVSPVFMTLALIAVYLLARLLIGSIPSVAVMALVAASPVTLTLVNNPNSHAATLGLVAWGMYLLVRWWMRGGWWAALFAGVLIGSAVSIRYSEGLLILPVAFVALMRVRDGGWHDRRRWDEAVLLCFAWVLPVALLLCHNQVAMGAWTGYDPTHESTGFSWEYLTENWDTMLRQIYQTGMMLIFPLAVAGLAASFVWEWRAGVFLCLWIVPSVMLYTAYYWAPDGQNTGYTRFFLTIFPGMGISAFGLMLWPITHLRGQLDAVFVRRLKWGSWGALGVTMVLSLPLGVSNIYDSLKADVIQRQNLQYRARRVMAQVPAGAVLLSEDMNLLHHLQLVADYVLYAPEVWQKTMIDRMGPKRPDEPQPPDPGRAAYLKQLTGNMSQGQLDQLRDQILLGAMGAGRRVFVFSGSGIRGPAGAWRGLSSGKLEMRLVETGSDPKAMMRPNRMGQFGMGRNRNEPTTLPVATWQIYEVVNKPIPVKASTTRPAARPAATRPTTRPTIRP